MPGMLTVPDSIFLPIRFMRLSRPPNALLDQRCAGAPRCELGRRTPFQRRSPNHL
jgi:hypothetical protein